MSLDEHGKYKYSCNILSKLIEFKWNWRNLPISGYSARMLARDTRGLINDYLKKRDIKKELE